MKIKSFTQLSEWNMALLLFAFMIWQLPDSQAGNEPVVETILLEEAFQYIGQEYGVFFNYDREIIADVTVEYESGKYDKVETALEAVFKQTQLRYQIFDDRFVAVYRDNKAGIQSMKQMITHFQNIVDQREGVTSRKEMVVSPLSSQNLKDISQKRIVFTVTGTITDEKGEPLVGVNIQVRGSSKGTATDALGKFTLEDIDENDVLIVSYVGYQTQEIPVNNRSTIDVVLTSNSEFLDEVIVTGYMTQRKKDLTGSIALASESDIQKNSSANIMKSLQGKLAGVHITTNGGNPAESVNIQIRGLSSLSGAVRPLIVLDGMPTENLNLRDINAGDIQSIQVLKDAASASIYGARASGGVILIETKKGEVGVTKVEYNGSIGLNKVVDLPQLMDARQYGIATFRAQAYDEQVYGTPLSLPSTYDFVWHRDDNGIAVLDDVKPADWLNNEQTVRGSNTNWLDEILQPALLTSHQLSISSGTERSKSLFSLGFYDNQGTQIHTFFRQYSLRANTEYNVINNRLKIGENLAVSYLQMRDGNQTWSAMINPPAVPVYDENGGWAGAAGFDDFTNPVRVLTDNQNNIFNYVKVIGNIYLDLNIWNGISARTQMGVDYGNSYQRTLEKEWAETGGRSSNGENYVSNNQSHPLSYVWTNTLSYNLSKTNHTLDVVAGTEFTRFVQEGFSARREGVYLEDRDFAHLNVTTGDKYSLGSSADEYVYYSLFGKANYAYLGKYLISATLRRDGSSLFGVNNRYGVFPAVSAGWRIGEESFMDNVEFVSDLKLRAGWGANGSVQGLPRGYTSTPFSTNYFATSYPIAGNETGHLYSGYHRTWLGNPDLKWETTTQTDLAIDFSLFDYRLNGSIGYYYKETYDILVQTPYIAALGEGGEPWINGADMNNRGFEFELGFNNDPIRDFTYSFSVNLGSYKTEIVSIPENVINKYPGDGMEDNVIGKTPNILYGLVSDGIFKSEAEVEAHAEQNGKAVGRLRYLDLNGDGRVEELTDRDYIGVLDPDFFGGMTFDFGYRNFDLNVFFQGVFGNMVQNSWKYEATLWNISVPAHKNHEVKILDGWYFDNPNSDNPAISNSNQNAEIRLSSYFVENGSYLKLRNIELGYTLPESLSGSMAMRHLRLYLAAKNVLTFKKSWGADKFTSFDPEMPGYGYLTPLTMTFGLNVTF